MPGVYREHAPPPGLSDLVACVWTSHDGAVRVLPDGCVDVVWSAGRLLVAGPATRAVVADATPGQPRCGVRFRVGAAGTALGLPADTLRDESVELAEVWGRAATGRITDRVAGAASVEAAASALLRGVGDRVASDGDPLVRQAVAEVAAGTPVGVVARQVAVSERQLLRRFRHAVGYGPRTLARVQRLQRFLAASVAAPPGTALGRLAVDAGYADHAHLARECRALAGASPSVLLASGAAPAGDRSLAACATR